MFVESTLFERYDRYSAEAKHQVVADMVAFYRILDELSADAVAMHPGIDKLLAKEWVLSRLADEGYVAHDFFPDYYL